MNDMIEIIGGDNIRLAFAELNINAKFTYKSNHLPFPVEVWEISIDDFKILCDYPDEKWKDEWGWWRQGHCIYHGNIYNYYAVNGKMMYGYEPNREENYKTKPYLDFYKYLLDVHHVSTFYNFCYFAFSLADDNKMKVSEFLKEYQP